ncbi:MAG: hypothetical protein ACREC5_06110, partial [Thermoplasmata archaeon]
PSRANSLARSWVEGKLSKKWRGDTLLPVGGAAEVHNGAPRRRPQVISGSVGSRLGALEVNRLQPCPDCGCPILFHRSPRDPGAAPGAMACEECRRTSGTERICPGAGGPD